MDDFVSLAMHCSKVPAFVAEYDRLSGSSFGHVLKADPLGRAIDEATGRTRDEWIKFMAFVFEVVWLRLPPECFAEPKEPQVEALDVGRCAIES